MSSQERGSSDLNLKINADYFRKNANEECERELYVSLIPMLPIIENEVDLKDADHILYMHPYARMRDYSGIVLEELGTIDKLRKPGAEIIVVGKAANAENLLNGRIKDITFFGDHYAEKTGKLLGFDVKDQYFVYDGEDKILNIWPVDGCLKKCGFCRRTFMNIKFESISLDTIKGKLDYLQKNEPEKMERVKLRAENLTEYGIDIYGNQQLHTLIDLIASYPEVKELYFYIGLAMSEITPKILDTICNTKKIVDIAINFETGSNRLLKLVNKGHTKEDAMYIYKKIRENLPDVIINSTVILGLPTEDVGDVLDTADVMNRSQIDRVLVNRYGYAEKHPIANLPQVSDSLFNYYVKVLSKSVKDYPKRDREMEVVIPAPLNLKKRKHARMKIKNDELQKSTPHGVSYYDTLVIRKR